MALDHLEERLIEFMGATKESLRNLEQSQRDQGVRIGGLESKINQHLQDHQQQQQKRNSGNGRFNGIKGDAAKIGGGGVVGLIVERLIAHLF